MIYDLLIAALLIVAFFMCILSFLWGFKLGKAIRNDTVPQVKLNPVKAYTEHREEKKKAVKEEKIQDLYQEGFNNLMTYDGTPQE